MGQATNWKLPVVETWLVLFMIFSQSFSVVVETLAGKKGLDEGETVTTLLQSSCCMLLNTEVGLCEPSICNLIWNLQEAKLICKPPLPKTS